MTEDFGRLERDGAFLAWRRVAGAGPTVLWLGGFHSAMAATKADALAAWAGRTGRDFLRFDYFGHGVSSGAFADGTITRWRGDALAVIDQLTEGPLILVGSSMGGRWRCLAALARPERVGALVLIAPAADFTERLDRVRPCRRRRTRLWPATGVWRRPPRHTIPPAIRSPAPCWKTAPAGRSCPAQSRSRRPYASCRAAPIRTCPGPYRLELANTLEDPRRGLHPDPRRRPPPLAAAGHRPARGGRGGVELNPLLP